jgi:hypothetical protein
MPFYIMHSRGECRGSYDTLTELVQNARPWILDKVCDRWDHLGMHTLQVETYYTPWYGYEDRFIILDEVGNVVSLSHLNSVRALVPYSGSTYSGRWRPNPKSYKFRDGPVPGIRCHRGGGRGYHRWFRYVFELRANAAMAADDDADEYGVIVRGKRRNMPNPWDDQHIAGHGRGWKAHRKTQYKAH